MKKIPLKIVTAIIRGEKTQLIYRTNIRQLLIAPIDPDAGTSFSEMAEIIPILEKFAQADGEYLLLEDAEHALVSARLKAARFVENSVDLFDMVRSVIEAPDFDVKSK